MQIPRRITGSATVHCRVTWHMKANFSVRWKSYRSSLAAGWWAVVRDSWVPHSLAREWKSSDPTDVLDRWWWSAYKQSEISSRSIGRVPRCRLCCQGWGRLLASAWSCWLWWGSMCSLLTSEEAPRVLRGHAKMGFRQREVPHWSYGVAGNFGELAGLEIPRLVKAILLCELPHKSLWALVPGYDRTWVDWNA
jgi:hypothetical protein